MSSRNVSMCDPRDQATHVDGAGLDSSFMSRSHAVDITVHSGVGCFPVAQFVAPSSDLITISVGGSHHALASAFLLRERAVAASSP